MPTTPAVSPLDRLAERLDPLTLRDQHRLRRRLEQASRARQPAVRDKLTAELTAAVEDAERHLHRRQAALPRISYPPQLPVSQRSGDLAAAIRDHQVVVVAGETGSGKTTQLPKICLELGRGVKGMVGHTQPRRLAARTVAERIAEELGTPLGDAVGYQVRFTDQVGDTTLVKLMTDGILLTEIQRDRMLRAYDTIIVDEAHERSLNIDFILGYLRQLLPRRPDLKVIITSATIDPERFSRHFGGAPVVEVSGRTYPVEVRYRPLGGLAESGQSEDPEGGDGDGDQIQAVTDAVRELSREGPGDILVFLSGEREIRDTADALAGQGLRDTEILPLYARLSAAEQHRVFKPHAGRRVVLATNVAETSLTVPGIRYVIDPGFARISRYSHRTKVQRLPIEAVSQASANQRKGRCGRTADGICIRLYSEDDFRSRPEFTDPEILRTNLASVILQMAAADLGDIAAFPFIDPPDRRQVTDGVRLLEELGALQPGQARQRLTPLGRKLAQLPVDPRLGRMILEAERNACVREVMVIAAALSIQDVRERPADKQQAADEQHRRFADPDSDFLAYLNLWQYLRERQKELSSSQFRRTCRREYLNYLRIREWQDLYAQLRQLVKGLGVTLNSTPGEADGIHRSLLAGLLSHVGLRDGDTRDYLGARGARFAVWPGSALARKPPQWLMAAELVETSRLWARTVARTDPAWVEALAGHLVKRSYSEPHWEKRRGAVMASERVTLFGVPLVAGRKVNYGRIDPPLARELFIRHALVEGDWDTRHAFFHENRKLLADVEELEHRARRRDILVDDQTLFDFYDQRVGKEVVSARHFDTWWKQTRASQPDLLNFSASMLVDERAGGVRAGDYPDTWVKDGHELRLTYAFEPGSDADGVTVHVPLPVLHELSPQGFEWLVPGMREELVTALLRGLPKPLRRRLVPVPDTAAALLDRIAPAREPPEEGLLDVLEDELASLRGVRVARSDWPLERLADHLQVTFRVTDARGRLLAEGKDLTRLQERLAPELREALATPADDLTVEGLRSWEVGSLPRTRTLRQAGHTVTAYPALVDEGDSVAVRVFESEAEQQRAMWAGTRRLLLLTIPPPLKAIVGRLPNRTRLAFGRSPYGKPAELLGDCVTVAADRLIERAGGPAWDQEGFARLRDEVRGELVATVEATVEQVTRILEAAAAVERRLAGSGSGGLGLLPSLTDVRAQLGELVFPGFVTATGWAHLPDVERYLAAIQVRLDKLPVNPARDAERLRRVRQVEDAYQELVEEVGDGGEVRRIWWMIQELRVSLFATTMRTAYPVSEQRIYRAMDELAA